MPDGLCQFESLSRFTRLAYRDVDARALHLDSLNMGSKHPCWTAHIGFETLLVYNAVCPRRSSTVDHRPSTIDDRPSTIGRHYHHRHYYHFLFFLFFLLFSPSLFFLCLSANVTTTRYALTASYCDSTSNFFFSPYILL